MEVGKGLGLAMLRILSFAILVVTCSHSLNSLAAEICLVC